MPLYTFECSKCGYKFDTFLCIAQRNQTQQCPECLGPAGRDMQSEWSDTSQTSGEHPRWSWSMGCTEVQAQKVLTKHPELESDFRHGRHGGPLLVHSRQDKLRKMSIFGMTEY